MNLFYRTLRSIVRLVLQIYFKKVSLQGERQIDASQPLLIAVNHPNSFLEACLLACWLKIPLHFIVRGDVFHPAFRWFFSWTNQIPIYRFRDGFSKLRNNYDTFQNCYEKLNEGKKILIFSEGSTKWTKQLRTIQRGTGHIAVGAMKAYPELPLQIVPVGVNYENVFKFRSIVEIKVDKPLAVPPVMSEENPVQKITGLLSERMSECVVHLEREEDIPLFDLICEIKDVFSLQKGSKLGAQFKIANALNDHEISSRQIADAQQLVAIKEKLGMNSLSSAHRHAPLPWALYLWWPIHLVLSALFGLPALLARKTAKSVYDNPAFEIPIRIGFSLIYYALYSLILLLITAIALDGVTFMICVLALVALSVIYIHSIENMRRWKDQHRWHTDINFPQKQTLTQNIENIEL